MKKVQYKKIIAAGMSLIMTASLLAGCGNSGQQTGADNTDSASDMAADGSGQTGEGSDSTAMGRYLEEVMDLSETLGGYREKLFVFEDEVTITQPMGSMQVSEDHGSTWKTEEEEWLGDFFDKGRYVDDYAVGVDGTIGIVYSEMDSQEETAGEAADNDETVDSDETGEDAESSDENSEDTEIAAQEDSGDENFQMGTEEDFWGHSHKNALIVRPDGTQIPITLPKEEEGPQHIWITDAGKVFVGTDNEVLYEIAEDGSGKVYLALEDTPVLIQFQGNRMIMDGYGFDELLIYDMEAEEYIEDAVLNDFVAENYGDRNFNGGSWYDLFFFGGEDDVLYLAGEKGVHRHVIGGSAMEQIVDASLTTFGNPSYKLLGMAAMGNNEFMALFTGARLVRYTYDPTVPTVPNERIKAYSLVDNTMLRKAIAIYQTEHPEVYVEYEVGMAEGSSVTREDALKKLNTEIMAGEGPDLLVLDNIPADSYIEKGLLKDLGPFVDSLSGDEKLFDNIVDAFRQDGRIYTIPCEVNLPTIMGKEEYVAKMTDLEGITEGMEELRKDNPGKDLLMLCSPKAVMKNFVTASAPAWMTSDGEINREAVEEFFAQTKRIYDAQMDGLPEEDIQRYEQWDKENVEYGIERVEDQSYYMFGMDEFNYLLGDRQILAGIIGYAYAYTELTSMQKIKGFEDNVIVPMNGLCSDVFCVQTLAGINASSSNMTHAEGLLKVLLGTENITSYGFPVNQTAFEKELYPDDYESPDEIYSTLGYLDDNGNSFTWQIYWFDEDEANELRERMKTVNTPYVENEVIEEAVFNAGVRYMNGEIELDEAVADVEKSMAIYLAE